MKTPVFQALVLGLPVCRSGVPSSPGKHVAVNLYYERKKFLRNGLFASPLFCLAWNVYSIKGNCDDFLMKIRSFRNGFFTKL